MSRFFNGLKNSYTESSRPHPFTYYNFLYCTKNLGATIIFKLLCQCYHQKDVTCVSKNKQNLFFRVESGYHLRKRGVTEKPKE